MNRNYRLLHAAAVFVLLGNFWGAGDEAFAADETSGEIHYGGTFTDGLLGDPKTLNPWVSNDSASSGATTLMFEPLFQLNPQTLKYEGRLGELPAASADGLTYTVKLKPDLKWSDGHALTADDVVFTLDVLYDESVETNYRIGLLIPVRNAKSGRMENKPLVYRKVDDLTVEFRFPTRLATAMSILAFPIAPKHKLEDGWTTGDFNAAWNVNTPARDLVSSGPWMLESYFPGKSLTYKRNPNFWRKDAAGNPLPYLEKYILKIHRQVPVVNWQKPQLMADVFSVDGSDYRRFKGSTGEKEFQAINLGASWSFSFLGFNMNPRAKIAAGKVALFRDVRFRRAISHAINRQTMINTLYHGMGHAVYGPETPADKQFYNPQIPKYAFNLTEARRLLREAGLRDRNGDGILEWKGRPFSFTIITNNENQTRLNMAAAIARNLKAVGIKAVFRGVPFGELISRVDSPQQEWEAIVLGFTGSPEPNDGANVWMSSGNMHMWQPYQQKPSTPWEAEIDELFRKGASTLDMAQRKKIYDRWQVIAAQQQPFIFLVTPTQILAVRRKFGNIKPTPLGGVLWNLEEIYDRNVER